MISHPRLKFTCAFTPTCHNLRVFVNQSERESVQLSIRNASLEDQLSRFRRQQQLQQHHHQQRKQQPAPLAAEDGAETNARRKLGGVGVGHRKGGVCGYPIPAGGSQGSLSAFPAPGPACLTRKPPSTAGEKTLLCPPPHIPPLSRLVCPLPLPGRSSLSLSPSRGESRTANVCDGNKGGRGGSGSGSGGGGGGEGGAGVVDGEGGEPSSSHAAASNIRGNSKSSSSSRCSIGSSSIGSNSSSSSSSSIRGSNSGEQGRGVRFERLFSKDIREGRVAAFAGENAGALLVSQELGEAGGPRGSASHGVTKVRKITEKCHRVQWDTHFAFVFKLEA